VRDILGAAAFSVAVRAEDARTREEVCLKIVKNDKDFFDQSLDEVKLLKMMNDADARDEKNIVRMLDFFYHREHLFIVTELLGLNLYEHQKLCLRRRADARRGAALRDDGGGGSDTGPSPYFSVKALRVVAKQVLVALEFMHARGVIHCDVKPENIVLRRGDANARRRRVKVIDLGSSCFTTDHLSTYVQSRSYRAPEVVLGAPYDGKADLWSLGCVLAELFTGQVLLRNESTRTALARVIGIFGPLDPELLRLGKHAGALVTAAGVPYERLDAGAGEDGGEDASDDASDDGESGEERVRVLLPKRTSLAARLGLPPLGVACDARSPANGAARGSPAPMALPAGFAAAFEAAATLDETSVGAADGADGPSGIHALDVGTTTTVSPEPIERVSTSKRAFRKKPRGAWTATEEKDGFIEFLLLLLQPNPRRRPTAARALAHDWLAGDDDDFEDAWVPPQTASPYGDARERDILAQL
jgi:serine/threonine protein kinase